MSLSAVCVLFCVAMLRVSKDYKWPMTSGYVLCGELELVIRLPFSSCSCYTLENMCNTLVGFRMLSPSHCPVLAWGGAALP